jgi:hypothetical protein
MFWLPFVTVTSSIFGGLVERVLGSNAGIFAWLLRAILPLISGIAWFAVTEAARVNHVDKPLFDLLMFVTFSVPAWVGVYAVRRSRADE